MGAAAVGLILGRMPSLQILALGFGTHWSKLLKFSELPFAH